SSRSLPEADRFLCVGTRLPLADLCRGYGIAYTEASSESELKEAFKVFIAERQRPALLAIHTCGSLSARVLRDYFQ
ncbi:MAG: hypothetical protein J1E29_08840, partial [Duncaniella sp.]|nr:hypothetical protein [Duncaniella sp.]